MARATTSFITSALMMVLFVSSSATLAFQITAPSTSRSSSSSLSLATASSRTLNHQTTISSSSERRRQLIEQEKKQWVENSLQYYTKVARIERRKSLGQLPEQMSEEEQRELEVLAKKHYFALQKIKDGKPHHAERIYRKIISELSLENEEESCDHAKLAVTTLLMALNLQRLQQTKAARAVFLSFFRRVREAAEEGEQCACSAKVLHAFALFEMKAGNATKSYHLVQRAIKLDPSLKAGLGWKQFRDAAETVQRRKQQRLAVGLASP